MAVVRWVFEDPVTLETYNFAVNPSQGGTPGLKKTINYANTSAPNGKVVVFEGRDEVQRLEFSGTILEEAEYNAFMTWADKRYQIVMTDDLGRSFSLIIESFEAQRQRAIHYPWKHSYSVSALIVDWE